MASHFEPTSVVLHKCFIQTLLGRLVLHTLVCDFHAERRTCAFVLSSVSFLRLHRTRSGRHMCAFWVV